MAKEKLADGFVQASLTTTLPVTLYGVHADGGYNGTVRFAGRGLA